MNLFNKFKQWQFSKNRLEAFSDGVFAIVITLLVLELKLPHIEHTDNVQEIVDGLKAIAPKFFGWVISFFFVALMWLHHHSIMHMSTTSDYGVVWINNILLFFICLLPFPTAMMGEHPMQPLLVTIWGTTVSITTLVLTWLYYYCSNNYLDNDFDKKSVMKHVRLSLLAGPTLYFAAALLAWISVYIAYAIYLFVPLLYILPLDKRKG